MNTFSEKGNGLRYRGTKKKQLMNDEDRMRQELFGSRLVTKPKENSQATMALILAEIKYLRREQKEAFDLTHEAAVDHTSRLVDIQGGQERLEEGQGRMKTILNRVDAGVKKIGQTTDKILGITERTQRIMEAYKGGDWRAIAHATILDEWLVFYSYFLLHPWMPITVESIASVWQFVLVINRVLKLPSEFRNGGTFKFSVGGVIYSYFTSPWKAIALLYFFNQEFIRMEAENPAEYASLFPGSLDPAFQTVFGTLMSGSVPRLETVTEGVQIGFDAAYKSVTGVFHSMPHLWDIVSETCPTWAENKRSFFNCVAAYMSGTLAIVGKEGAKRLIAVPGLMHQAGMYLTVEKQVIFAVCSLVWSHIITPLFGSGLSYIGELIRSAICSIVPSGGLFGWSFAASLGCKDKAVGGGSSSRRMTIRRGRKNNSREGLYSQNDMIEAYQLLQKTSLLYVQCVFLQENAPIKMRYPKPLLKSIMMLYIRQLQIVSNPAILGEYVLYPSIPDTRKLITFEEAINSNNSR